MRSLRFANAMEAVQWAEELGSRPICDTQFVKLLKKGGGGYYTPQELRDLALSITNATVQIDKPWGLFFISIYGAVNVWAVMGIQSSFATLLHKGPLGSDKDPEQLRKLVGGVCEAIRRKMLYGKTMSRASIAAHIGIDKRRFCESGWPELEAQVRATLLAKLTGVEAKLNDVLRTMDLLT